MGSHNGVITYGVRLDILIFEPTPAINYLRLGPSDVGPENSGTSMIPISKTNITDERYRL